MIRYLHLVNDIPMVGLMLNLTLFLLGFVLQNTEMQLFSYGAFILLSVISLFSYGVDLKVKEALMRGSAIVSTMTQHDSDGHSRLARFLFAVMMILGAAGVTGLMLIMRDGAVSQSFFLMVGALSLLSLGLMFYRGIAEYKRRHSEIPRKNAQSFEHAPLPDTGFDIEREELSEIALEQRLKEDQLRLLETVMSHHLSGRRVYDNRKTIR